jgi:hypothetical protein
MKGLIIKPKVVPMPSPVIALMAALKRSLAQETPASSSAYSAAKAGVHALVCNLAIELLAVETRFLTGFSTNYAARCPIRRHQSGGDRRDGATSGSRAHAPVAIDPSKRRQRGIAPSPIQELGAPQPPLGLGRRVLRIPPESTLGPRKTCARRWTPFSICCASPVGGAICPATAFRRAQREPPPRGWPLGLSARATSYAARPKSPSNASTLNLAKDVVDRIERHARLRPGIAGEASHRVHGSHHGRLPHVPKMRVLRPEIRNPQRALIGE